MKKFEAFEMAMVVLERLEKIEPKIRKRRKSLADQIARSSEGIPLCLAEGNVRTGLDKPDLFRRALGSAKELTAGLMVAKMRRYISEDEFAWVDEPLDRVRAMTWRLTH